MSDSYPTIQESLSEVQKDFMGCVEMHLDPPEFDERDYSVEALYRFEPDSEAGLPGDEIRFALSVTEVGEDVAERRHTIEFVKAGSDRPSGWIRHKMKRIEGFRGRYVWTESLFEVAAPGIPDGRANQAEVEVEVRSLVDMIRALDRRRQLMALPD
jgi:hypothetical protein